MATEKFYKKVNEKISEEKDTRMKCSICGGPIAIQISGWREGHNAYPVNEGRCCDYCNENVVIPTRIDNVMKARKH